MKKILIFLLGVLVVLTSPLILLISRVKSQEKYTEAKNTAIADILQELNKEGKVFIAYNPKRTININIIIATECTVEPTPIDEL